LKNVIGRSYIEIFLQGVILYIKGLQNPISIILKAIHENLVVKKSTLQQLTDFSASAIDENLEILKK